MKILLAIDGSKFSKEAVTEITRRSWPADSEVRILSVANPSPLVIDPLLIVAASHYDSLSEEKERASHDVAEAEAAIAKGSPNLKLSTSILVGSPKERIVEEAERWSADLVLVGSHGYGPVQRFLLGSVAQAVALHAPCSVEIVRSRDQSVSGQAAA